MQTYDEKPRRRLWELMKSQGMQENQQVVFMSDGGENVRRMQEYLHPFSEHLIDWFHITMRLTVLQQQTKELRKSDHKPARMILEATGEREAPALAWQYRGGTGTYDQLGDRPGISSTRGSAADGESRDGVAEFETYIRNNLRVHPQLRRT